jgi:methionine-rich copper-binding protein CopC
MFKKSIAVLCALSLVFSQIAAIGVSAKDKTAPAMKVATPKNNATGIATNVKISLKFSENIYKSKYFSKIKLTKSNKATTITSSIYKNYLKISHKYSLAYKSSYVLTVPAYSVKDKTGNILKKAIIIKFKTKAKPEVHTPTPTPTVTPTPSPTDTPTATPVVLEALDSTATYMSAADNADYSKVSGFTMTSGQVTGYPCRTTGIQRMEYDVTPSINNVDGALSIADGTGDVTSADNLALSVRLNSTGAFDCTNGATVGAAASVTYTAGTKYHVVIVANMDAKTYSAWVTPDGGSETQIAADYAFKTTAAATDDMGKVFLTSAAGGDLQFETVVRKSVYTPGVTYSSFEENGGWQDNGLFLGYGNTGTVTIEYDASATKAQADGSVDFAGANVNLTGFGDLSMLIRFSGVTAAEHPGAIDVRNGSAGNVFKSDTQIMYTGGTVYHFRVVANTTEHTYSVWVTPPGEAEIKIATDYGFRPTALADEIGQVFVVSAYETDLVSMSNLTISHV